MSVGFIEANSGEIDKGRAPFVLKRIIANLPGDPTFVSPDKADVLVYLFNWDDGLATFRDLTGLETPLLKARGYVFPTVDRRRVIPTYHPGLIGKGKMNLMPIAIFDIATAFEEMSYPWVPEWPYEDLILHPSPDEFRDWCREARQSSFLVHDIETAYSKKNDEDEDKEDDSYTILRFSLADERGHAITAPFKEPFVQLWKELAQVPNDKVGWNSDRFDDPREFANAIPITGRRIDAMWLYRYLQPSLPKSLGHVSNLYDRVPEWKSIGSSFGTEDELYSAMDSRQTRKNYLSITNALRNRKV